MAQTNVNIPQRTAGPYVAPRRAVAVAPDAVYAPSSAALAVAKANQILWFACGVLELLLIARVALRMLGANPAAGFVAFIYALTQPLAGPFLGMLPNAAGGAPGRGTVLEVPTLIAMIVYFVLFLLL